MNAKSSIRLQNDKPDEMKKKLSQKKKPNRVCIFLLVAIWKSFTGGLRVSS